MQTGCRNKAQNSPLTQAAEATIDTISYGFGVNMGMATNRQWGGYDLDIDQVRRGIEEFLMKNKEEDIAFRNRLEHLKAFTMYSHVKQYLRAKAEQLNYTGNRPDTLPPLPELYDAENRREDISFNVGVLIGTNIIRTYDEPVVGWVIDGFNDGIVITDPNSKDSMIKIQMNEINESYKRYMTQRAKRKKSETNKD